MDEAGRREVLQRSLFVLERDAEPRRDPSGLVTRQRRVLLQLQEPRDRLGERVEVLFEVPEDELARAAEVCSKAMRRAFELEVPLVVGVEAGKNWADLEPVSVTS